MKCTICGQDIPLGATVCAHCEAALKRAYDTVSPIKPPARSAAADKPAAAAPSAAKTIPEAALPIGAINPLATGLPRRRTAVAAVIAILAVAVFAYYEFRAPPADRSNGHRAAVAAPAAMPVTLSPAPPVNATDSAAASSPLQEGAAAPPNPSSSTSSPSVGAPKALPARARKPAASAAAPMPSAIEPAPVPVATPSGVASAPVQAAPEPPAPDRWQQMREAIAQCAPDNLFGRIVCEQRVRLRYCEGFWGQTPQCPAGPSNDHGQ
jgi:hypothetical protein